MRVTQETREKTRRAILDRAQALFGEVGFEAATTRQIASAAGIGAGTLFNYFPTKEALGMALVADAIEEAEAELEARVGQAGQTLEERLFGHIATQLRALSPTRAWIGEVFDVALSPLRVGNGLASELRRRHLERVAGWLTEAADKSGREPAPAELPEPYAEEQLSLHLYWSLYLGVVSFWARDASHNQEATLALLDRSIRLFCRALREE